MTSNRPFSTTDTAIQHGLRSTIHPLNLEHFRQQRRAYNRWAATEFLKVALGGLAGAIIMYAFLFSSCFIR